MNPEFPVPNQRSELEEALRQQTEESARLGTYRLDLQTGQAEYSPNLYRLYGLEPGSLEFNMLTVEDFIHPNDFGRVQAFREQLLSGQGGGALEFRIRRADGAQRHLRATVNVIQTADGMRFLVGTSQDVTDEVTLRQQLQHRHRFVELLIDSSADRILALDRELRLMAWNRTNEAFHGIKREEVIGRPFFEMFPAVKHYAPAMDAIHRALAGETVFLPAMRGIYSPAYYDQSYSPIHDENGTVEGVLCSAHDVTARIEAEEKLKELNATLERQNQALQRSNRELADLNYAATHDLREPLRKIQTFAGFMEKRESAQLSPEGRLHLVRIRQAAERMETLMDGLRQLASISLTPAGELPDRVDLRALIQRVQERFEEELAVSHAILEVGSLPVIPGHTPHLQQLFVELIDNALKFQPMYQVPRIRIHATALLPGEIEACGLAPGKSYLRIDVEDNGIGLEPEYTEQIFQLFQRLHDHTAFAGAGAGLAICKKIVDLHGGAIRAGGEPGVGARFSVYLPSV